MKKRNVIITGCSSGIGRCVAEGLKQRGYRVFATARKKTDVDILVAEGFESVQLDLANSASIRSAFATILEKSGGEIYALFNNGAYGQPGAVEDLSRDVLRQQFEVNLFGTHELTNLVLPVMRKHRPLRSGFRFHWSYFFSFRQRGGVPAVPARDGNVRGGGAWHRWHRQIATSFSIYINTYKYDDFFP